MVFSLCSTSKNSNQQAKTAFSRFYVLFLMVFLLGLQSCNHNQRKNSKHVWIDFKDSSTSNIKDYVDSSTLIKVAIASIISPQETFIQFNKMLSYIEVKLNRKVILVQRKTYQEVNTLLKNNKIDLAFICSGAYTIGKADNSFSLLVIPEINGKHYYRAYLIVHKNSKIKSFEELRNKKFVFSDSLSNTGMFYPLKRLNDLKTTKNKFFAETYFSNAHNYSIELVSRGIVDGASVNSLIYDYQTKYSPEKIENTKVIEKSDWYGMPPVVVSTGIDKKLKEELLNIFTQMNTNKEGQEILNQLLIDKYIQESDTIYNNIREMCRIIQLKNEHSNQHQSR